MSRLEASFPVSLWVDEYLKENYGITMEWLEEKLIVHKDYSDLSVVFDLEDIHGSAQGIKDFLRDYDLGDCFYE